MYRLKKTASAFAYLLLIWLTWQWFRGDLTWGFSLGCILVSSLWLALTFLELGDLFRTYFDIFSRLKIIVPTTIGAALSALALWFARVVVLKWCGGLLLVAWLSIYVRYRINCKKYKSQGHGPLPKNAWVNPPVDAIRRIVKRRKLVLILTSGRMANRLHESVGHGEIAVIMPDGKMYFLSSYMEKGAILQEADAVADKLVDRGHYIALEVVQELDDDQLAALPHIVNILLRQNAGYRTAAQARREKLFGKLWLPAAIKQFMIKKFPVTGYDWLGLLIGQRHADRWTCIGICLELLRRLGIKTNEYGTGILGLGTGLFDPIMPVRFLWDLAFRLLTLTDRDAYEAILRSEQSGQQS